MVSIPLKHARFLELRFEGTSIVRYLPVTDGQLHIKGGPCGDTLGGIEPGQYRVAIRPVGPGGMLGPQKSLTLDVPARY